MPSRRHRRTFARLATAALLATAMAAPAGATNDPAWQTVASWPDLMGGIWGIGEAIISGGPAPGKPLQPIELTARGKQVQAEYKASHASLDGSHGCNPDGLPITVGGQFFYTKGQIFLLSDLDFAVTRQIFMKDRHDPDPELSYYGDSIGRWDGNTLVVDTTGFLPEVLITDNLPGNSTTHMIERFKLTGRDTMEYTQVVENSELLVRPITIVRMLNLNHKFRVHEVYCSQNNRDEPIAGRAQVDMTPPK